MSARGQACAYCGAPAVHWDHVVPRSVWKRGAWPSWADRLGILNALGFGKFRVWSGDMETLHEVAK